MICGCKIDEIPVLVILRYDDRSVWAPEVVIEDHN